MKTFSFLLLTLLPFICLSQTHILTLPNDVKKDVDIISENNKSIKIKTYPEGKERSIPRTAIVSLIEKLEVPPLNYNDDNRIEFLEVFEIEGMNKEQLFTASKVWMVNYYNSAEDVIQSEDKESGLIIGKGIGTLVSEKIKLSGNYSIKYTIKIQFKDGRYKVTASNINTNNAAIAASIITGTKSNGVYDYKQPINTVVSDKAVIRNNGSKKKGNLETRKLLIKHFNDLFLSLKESIQESKNDSDW